MSRRQWLKAVGVLAVSASAFGFGFPSAVYAGSALQAQGPAPSSSPPPYVIGPGDVLQVVVWKEPDLTRDVTVRVDGRITIPLLGDVPAAGRTPADLGEEMGTLLARFVREPVVTVGVVQANSQRVYVLGQVIQPGAFLLGSRMTLLQVLALAGGFREFAKTDRILIIRDQPGLRVPLEANYKKLEGDKDLSQNIVLKPGDTVIVP
jgi:polysaccharide export outer membrane protein